jgi:hypothetical protein
MAPKLLRKGVFDNGVGYCSSAFPRKASWVAPGIDFRTGPPHRVTPRSTWRSQMTDQHVPLLEAKEVDALRGVDFRRFATDIHPLMGQHWAGKPAFARL